MTHAWQTKKLVDVATLQRGLDLPTRDRVSGVVPLVTSSGITDTHDKSAVRGPGVATGRSGSIGKVFFIEEDFWPLNTVLYVKDFHGNDPRFVFYLLKKFDLKRFASGSGVPTLNRNFVHDELVSVPPLSEQQRIVGILDEAFEGIGTAKANTETNLRNAHALFQSALHSAFTTRGDGWVDTALGDVLEVQNGYAFDSEGFDPSAGMPLIRIRDLKVGTETATRFTGDYDEKYVVTAGDLLIGMDGEFGCYEWKGSPALLNQRVCRLQGFTSNLAPRFLFYGVNSHLKAIEDVTGYATVKHLSSKQILRIAFPLPPLPEQRRIADQLDSLAIETQRLAALYEQKLAALKALQKSLLHQALTGDLGAQAA